MEFLGVVSDHHVTSNGTKYSVVKFKNSDNLNYRLFIPGVGGKELQLRQKVKVTIDPIQP